MTARTITEPGHPDMPFFRSVYEEAFPEDERCPWDRMAGFLSLPGHPFRLEGLYLDDGRPAGFNAYSVFGPYVYAIYLAIGRAFRGSGCGSQALAAFHARHAGRLIFGEIEHPATPLAQRRLAFYQALGYHATDIGFVQPPLSLGLGSVPYLIISYPAALTPDDAAAVHEILTQVIYVGR